MKLGNCSIFLREATLRWQFHHNLGAGAKFTRQLHGIGTLTWIGREKTLEGRKSAFHVALRTHVSCFQTSNA